MSKKLSRFICTVYATLILAPACGIFLLPKEEISERENRMLADMPKISSKSILNGKFSQGFSSYCADRFPLRDEFLLLNSSYELGMGRFENGGVIRSREGNLIKRADYSDLSEFKANLFAINSLTSFAKEKGGKAVFFCAPTAQEVLCGFCPAPLHTDGMKEPESLTKALGAFSISNELKNKANSGEYVFYKTDHHWTALGAYYAYLELGKHLSYTPKSPDFFTPAKICDDFFGSSYSSSLFPSVTPDKIYAYRYDGDDRIKVTDQSTGETFGLYNYKALENVSKYDFFLGGNKAYLKVESGNKPTLIIIKDSFANSLIPFLAIHYNIHIIDPRYLNSSLNSLLEEIYREFPTSCLLMLFSPETLIKNVGLDKK